MKNLTVRETRAALAQLDQILAKEGEITITKHGRPIARVVPVRRPGRLPTNEDLRRKLPKLSVGSEVYVRQDRDERG